ncbi:helix-turn-helix domain-containing protein [Ensifer sp. 2YAB10]|uniref:helix-turn-helix domain-containing protein n=2 Tax=unclassified Ensifer TaxID=2633371 RepID=UPI003F9127D1
MGMATPNLRYWQSLSVCASSVDISGLPFRKHIGRGPGQKKENGTLSSYPGAKDQMQEPVVVHIGIRIRARRIRSRMSRAELGAAIGLTGGQVAEIERGVSWVSPHQLLSIAEALEVDASHFFQ